MPVSVTKSKIGTDEIQGMTQAAFGCRAQTITELTEGYFNPAYRLDLPERSVILKIAPSPDMDIMTHEKNIMFSEVDSMCMVRDKTHVPVPEILAYDNSRTLCEFPYFFMECLAGRSFSTQMEAMSQSERDAVYRKVGSFTHELNQITGEHFGYYCQHDRQGRDWYQVFASMILDACGDAKRKSISTPVTLEAWLELLEKDREIFRAVTTPRFVHWDIWAGNVFLDAGEVTGIIDFERCLWADPLMEVGFRSYGYQKAFFEGYGISGLTQREHRRALWYDVYLFLIAALECDYRQYDNRNTYHWACERLEEWYRKMQY